MIATLVLTLMNVVSMYFNQKLCAMIKLKVGGKNADSKHLVLSEGWNF